MSQGVVGYAKTKTLTKEIYINESHNCVNDKLKRQIFKGNMERNEMQKLQKEKNNKESTILSEKSYIRKKGLIDNGKETTVDESKPKLEKRIDNTKKKNHNIKSYRRQDEVDCDRKYLNLSDENFRQIQIENAEKDQIRDQRDILESNCGIKDSYNERGYLNYSEYPKFMAFRMSVRRCENGKLTPDNSIDQPTDLSRIHDQHHHSIPNIYLERSNKGQISDDCIQDNNSPRDVKHFFDHKNCQKFSSKHITKVHDDKEHILLHDKISKENLVHDLENDEISRFSHNKLVKPLSDIRDGQYCAELVASPQSGSNHPSSFVMQQRSLNSIRNDCVMYDRYSNDRSSTVDRLVEGAKNRKSSQCPTLRQTSRILDDDSSKTKTTTMTAATSAAANKTTMMMIESPIYDKLENSRNRMIDNYRDSFNYDHDLMRNPCSCHYCGTSSNRLHMHCGYGSDRLIRIDDNMTLYNDDLKRRIDLDRLMNDKAIYGRNFVHWKHQEAYEDGGTVWGPEVEQAFKEAIKLYPQDGRKRLKKEDDGRLCGRNDLISKYIEKKTGQIRSTKQISSHIQVHKRRQLASDTLSNVIKTGYRG